MASKGGQQAPNFKVPAPANGARTDMSGQQGVKVPTGLGYGQGGELRQLQQQVPLPAVAPSSGPSSSSPPTQAPGPQPSSDPTGDIINLISSHPTDVPNDTLAPQEQVTATQSLAFKVDALRYLSSLPWAGPEITTLFKQAQSDLRQAASTPPPATPQAPQGTA